MIWTIIFTQLEMAVELISTSLILALSMTMSSLKVFGMNALPSEFVDIFKKTKIESKLSCSGRADYAGIDYVDVLFGENMRGKDCQGHGSRVASIAVGRSLGIAYGAQVKSLRVGGVGCGSGTVLSALIEAINFIIKQKKANPSKLVSRLQSQCIWKHTKHIL